MSATPRELPAPRPHGPWALPVLALLAGLAGCQGPEVPLSEAPEAPPPASEPSASAARSVELAPSGAATAEPGEAAERREPSGYRRTKSGAVVYAGKSRRAGRRGRTEAAQPFAIYGVEPGPDCAEGWAAVDQGGFVCLEYAVASEGPAVIQPELAEGQWVPFIYARPKIVDRATGAIARVPRYRDRHALARGDEPLDVLGPDRQYTFVKTKTRKAGLMLIDAEDRAVLARDLKIAAPSVFVGRELAREPVPPGLRPAWSVSSPAVLRERPDGRAREVKFLKYHEALAVDPQPIVVGEQQWFAVPDAGGPGVSAYVVAADMNYWIPGPELAEAAADELWIDVELGQQTLAVMRGQSPVFVTLVSTGAGGSGTPLGLFRIYEKLAVTPMRSAPNAEDPYYVDGVPWVQYFHRRYALHASYWHDDFGKRRSHGCINLSPRDAARVYALTSPEVPPGWNSLVEHAGDPGTLVRVRRGADAVPDRRLPLGVIDEGQEGEE